MRRSVIGVLLAAAILSTACGGRNFVRPQPEVLALGSTTYGEIVGQFGDPLAKRALLKEGQNITRIGYAYFIVPAGVGDIRRERATGFYFVKDVLVGYESWSTFQEDLTDFDGTKVPEIKKGQTTRAQVAELMGRPSGMYTYPLIKNQSERALVYLYNQSKHYPLVIPKSFHQRLLVSFDSSEVVTDVEFTTSGER